MRTSGGAELQVALLARELSGRGHRVTIAAGDMGQPDRLELQGVRIRNAGAFHTGRIVEMLKALPRVFRVIADERPDWVVVMGWTAWLFILWLGRPVFRYRLNFICALDSEINGAHVQERPFFGRLFDFAVRHADARHAITCDQREVFRARGLDAQLYRYLVFPRRTPPSLEKKVDFLWVSRCQPIKRPHLFLELARLIPSASFEMICPPENRALWEQIAGEAAGLSNLRFIESVPYHRIQEHYDRAKIFVNTSEWEGWPNSFIQAGLGKTAILSLAVNPDGIFERFGLGLFASGNWERFVDGARELLRDPEMLMASQAGAARFLAEMHDTAKETTAYLAGLTARS